MKIKTMIVRLVSGGFGKQDFNIQKSFNVRYVPRVHSLLAMEFKIRSIISTQNIIKSP